MLIVTMRSLLFSGTKLEKSFESTKCRGLPKLLFVTKNKITGRFMQLNEPKKLYLVIKFFGDTDANTTTFLTLW